MLSPSAIPLRLRLDISIWLAAYLLLVHISALILIFTLDPDIYLLVFLATLIFISLIYYWSREISRSMPDSIIGVGWSEARGWSIRMRDGRRVRMLLCPSSFISRQLVILHLKGVDSGRRTLAIPADATDADQHRRLRMLLKMYDHFGM